MLKVHRWFILVGLVFIVFIALSTDFKSTFLNNEFTQWVKNTSKEMKEAGISAKNIQRFQDEVTEPLKDIGNPDIEDTRSYSLKVDENLLLQSRQFLQKNIDTLEKLSNKYKVDPNIVVSLIGYGSLLKEQNTKEDLVKILATLAFKNQNSAQYTHELFEFFKLVDSNKVDFFIKGYADGGFTPLHIFPSLYTNNIIDGNGDEKIDLLNSNADLLESGFNLLHNKDWEKNKNWGVLVKLPTGQDMSLQQGSTHIKSFKEWEDMGVKLLDTKSTPSGDVSAMLLLLNSKDSGILLYTNFSVIYSIKKDLQDSLTIVTLSSQLKQYNALLQYKKNNVKTMSKKQKLYKDKGIKKDDLPVPEKYRYLESIK